MLCYAASINAAINAHESSQGGRDILLWIIYRHVVRGGFFFYLNFSFVSSCNFHVDAKNFFFSFLFFLILRNISRTRLWSVEVSARGMCVYNTDRSLLQHCCYSVRWPGSSQWWIKGINTHNLTGVWNNTENNTWFFLLLSLLLFFHNTDVTRQIR